MTVIDLEQRTVERLAIELRARLEEYGTVVADVGEVGNVERWRKAARLAGRSLGESVRTMRSCDGSTVFAFSNRRVEPGQQAAAAQRVADWLFGPSPHLRLVKLEDDGSLAP
jgi:hypothetical protein